MTAEHLVGNAGNDVREIEVSSLVGHLGMEHDLKQKIAQFVPEAGHVAVIDGLGDLVGLFDGVRRDGREILFYIPRTAAVGVAELRHDVEKSLDVCFHAPCSQLAAHQTPKSG